MRLHFAKNETIWTVVGFILSVTLFAETYFPLIIDIPYGVLLLLGLFCVSVINIRGEWLTAKYSLRCVLCAMFTGIAVLPALSLTNFSKMEIIQGFGVWFYVLVFMMFAVGFYVIFKGFCLFIEKRKKWNTFCLEEGSLPSGRIFVWIWGIAFFNLSIHWLPYFPARISNDSMSQWAQIHGQINYNNIHTLGHTIFLKGLLSIWDNYGFVIFVQLMSISLFTAAIAKYFYKRGISYAWLVCLSVLFTICTGSAGAYLYPWKDTPYALSLVLITWLIIRTLDKYRTVSFLFSLLVGISLASAYLFRHNGLVALVICSGYFIFYFTRMKEYKKLIVMIVSIVLCISTVNFYAYNFLGAQKVNNGTAVAVFGTGVAAVVAKQGNITEEQYRRIENILSIEWIRDKYRPFDGRRLMWEEGVNLFVDPLGKNKDEIIKLYFELLPNNFIILFQDVIYNTYVVWGFMELQIFSSNVFLLLLLLLTLSVTNAKFKDKKVFLIFLPLMSNVISVAISATTNELRYMLPTYTLFPLIFLYIICHGENLNGQSKYNSANL